MSNKLVIFGISDFSEVACQYFTDDSDYEVVAFCVDAEYRDADTFSGLPVHDFETIQSEFPPQNHHMFIGLGYSKLNASRKEKFLAAKDKGYILASYISTEASFLSQEPVGENTFIFEDNTIQPFVTIGDNVVLWSGNHVGHHSRIMSHTFIASHAVISGRVVIGEQCFIGVNATLRDHITIGDKSIIGAGTLILSDVEPEGVYIGTETARSKVPSTRLRSI